MADRWPSTSEITRSKDRRKRTAPTIRTDLGFLLIVRLSYRHPASHRTQRFSLRLKPSPAEQKLPSPWKPKFGIRIGSRQRTFAVFLLTIPAIEADRPPESPDPPARLMVQVDAVPVDGRPLKRARLRKEADVILPLPAGDQGADGDSFRRCVRSLIARHARVAPMPGLPQLRTWRIAFRIGAAVDLEVVEEDVAKSRRIYCDHCRIVGESDLGDASLII